MVDDVIPEDVRQFILDHIESIAQLEGLLLLRSSPGVFMCAAEISERLYISGEEAAEFLESLFLQELLDVSVDQKFTYKPGSTELEQGVDKVAEIYARYLVPLTNLIHSKPRSKVQKFADAFKIRKD
jgi:hypothetical protein